MVDRWLKGEIRANCLGRPTKHAGGSGLARWYALELSDAVVERWSYLPQAPLVPNDQGTKPFSQARIEKCRLRAQESNQADEMVILVEASISPWRLVEHVEAPGETTSVLRGTLYAKVLDDSRRAALPEGGAIDTLGCLGVLLSLLVMSWLWFRCGPFTAALWASVCLSSWFLQRWRMRRSRRTPLALKLVHGVLGLALVVLGVLAAIDLSSPSTLSSCEVHDASHIALAALSVIGTAWLSLRWPLRLNWLMWTAIVTLWCGRTNVDCAGSWAQESNQRLRALAPREWALLDEWFSITPREHPTRDGDISSQVRAKGSARTRGGGGLESRSGGEGTGDATASGAPGPGTEGAATPRRTTDGFANTATGDGTHGASVPADAKEGKAGSPPPVQPPDEMPLGLPHGPQSAPEGSSRNSPALARDGVDEALGEALAQPRSPLEGALRSPEKFLSGAERLTLPGDLLFDFDEVVIRPQATPKLQQVAQLLRRDPTRRFLLEGHADTIGGDAYNQRLSERRAEAVRSWFIDQAHINPLQLDYVGYGNSQPLVPASKSPAEQQPNRRVEILSLPH